MAKCFLILIIPWVPFKVKGSVFANKPYNYSVTFQSSSYSKFVRSFDYPEWKINPKTMLFGGRALSFTMALNERWNVDISGRSIDKWADLDLLFINVPFGVVPDKPAGILEYQLEIGVSQEIELIPKLNLLPEVGIVFREITYVYMIRIPVEYLTLKPEPPIHNAGLRYSCSLLYSAGKKERVLLGITGGYCDFNGLDTWLLGYQLGVRFNVKRKIVINE